jgi:spore germination cell wall hydrolase CwlJ-like protein
LINLNRKGRDCVNRSTKSLGIFVAVLIVSTGIFIESLYVLKDAKSKENIKVNSSSKFQALITDKIEVWKVEAERIEAEKLKAQKLEAEKLEAQKLEAEALEAQKVKLATAQAVAAKNSANRTLSRGGLTIAGASRKIDEEKDLFCRIVNAEAGGESLEGKLAVATVLVNRVNSGKFPNNIKDVVYDKNWGVQFTPVSDGRINNPASSESIKAVNMVLAGHRSFGANILYFLNPKTAESPWIIENKAFFKTIGSHNFYY